MKKVILVFFLFTAYIAQAQQKTGLVYDDNVQKRKVAAFSAISVSNSIDVYITQGNTSEVAVSANSEAARDRIVTEVDGGTLIIKLREESGWRWNKWGDIKAKAYVSVKALNALSASGACDIKIVDKVETPKLKIKLTGASDLKGDIEVGTMSVTVSGASEYKGNVKANDLFMDISGASDVELNGSTDDLLLEVSGASDASLYQLTTKGAKVEASGASSVKLNVTQLLKAHASGASSIDYKGAAIANNISSSGASSIKHKN